MKKQTLVLVKLTMCLALVLGFTAGWGADAALAAVDCDPDFVVQEGSRFTVLPTGTDDTANLQCAFDAAVDAGPGSEVRLLAGAYHTGQIVVNEFHGSFCGAGADETEVFNLPNLPVGPGDWNLSLPSAENPWPDLFIFLGGDFSISELALRITGDEPTQEWWIFGWGPFYELGCAIVITGSEAHPEISHVLVEGDVKEGSFFGYNLGNGIYFEGIAEWLGQPAPPISGSFTVHHSTFRTYGYGSPVYNLSDASVVVSHNDYEGLSVAMDGTDLVNTNIEFSHNQVESAAIGLDFWNNALPGHVGSTFLITNNLFRNTYLAGVAFEQTFGEGNQCLLLGNNVQNAGDLGIFLGEGTTGCTVVGGANKTNVLDLGIDNVLVGVNNMGSGVGPTIRAVRGMY
jgi:hypothetical protein